jgi:hypothetical protein
MRKLSLGHLLHLVIIVPLCVVAVLGGVLVLDSERSYLGVKQMSALEQLVTMAGRLTFGVLSEENAASHAFALSGSEPSRLELDAARLRADQAIDTFRKAVALSGVADAAVLRIVNEIEGQLQRLGEFRRKTDARVVTRLDSGS